MRMRMAGLVLGGVVAAFGGGGSLAQTPGQPAGAKATVTALMLSDVHFDPFRDPGKAQQLWEAQEGGWNAILGSAASADQPEAYARLQKACRGKRSDTPSALWQS